jgi:hypothetical protein
MVDSDDEKSTGWIGYERGTPDSTGCSLAGVSVAFMMTKGDF